MTDINIFDSATPQSGEFFKFSNVGDAVQGTYIDKKSGTDGYGNTQTIYVLKDSDGKIWNLGFKDSSIIIHERMNGIHMGQIVGFKYDEERENKKNPALHKAKIIRVYADPKFVDTVWLDEQKRLADLFGNAPKHSQVTHTVDEIVEEVDEDKPPFNSAVSSNNGDLQADAKSSDDAFTTLRQLAMTKGLINELMFDKEADEAIVAYAGMPMTEENLTKLIMKVVNYTK